jgi:hypothetical protein
VEFFKLELKYTERENENGNHRWGKGKKGNGEMYIKEYKIVNMIFQMNRFRALVLLMRIKPNKIILY